MGNRFTLPALVAPASPANTTAQLIDLRNTIQSVLNSLDDEANLRAYLLHGVGRAKGCVLTKDDVGILRLPNGYFQAGPGTDDTEDENYFPGARLVQVNAVSGYIELIDDNAPPVSGTWYGHMSAYGDVMWFSVPQVVSGERPGRRWVIGKVTTDASGAVTSLDATVADILGQSVSTGGGEGGEDGYTGYLTGIKYSSLDNRPSTEVIEGMIADLQALLNQVQTANNIFPSPFDILADEIALSRAGLAEVNPHSIERGQISVVVINAGHSQSGTPDFAPNSPTTNDPLELSWDAEEGTFG
ncbi:hypothetical protein EON83_17250 [bacterium]|nr:MAG: hypothetical protein EON83_17250 [bacterium]